MGVVVDGGDRVVGVILMAVLVCGHYQEGELVNI